MHLMGDEIAVEQTERSGKLLHDIKDFCRPVGQTEQAIALGFERHHPIVDTRDLCREDIRIALVKRIERKGIVAIAVSIRRYNP